MADASNASLLSVVVGGLLTMGGGVVGFIGSVILGVMQSSRDKKMQRAEKFGEFVSAVYEYEHWMDTKKNIQCYGEAHTLGISPLAKIEAIATVYFPSCSEKVRELERASMDYNQWMAQGAQKRVHGKMDEVNTGFGDVYKPYYGSLTAVLAEARKIAPTL
jgi:hypothetical protein